MRAAVQDRRPSRLPAPPMMSSAFFRGSRGPGRARRCQSWFPFGADAAARLAPPGGHVASGARPEHVAMPACPKGRKTRHTRLYFRSWCLSQAIYRHSGVRGLQEAQGATHFAWRPSDSKISSDRHPWFGIGSSQAADVSPVCSYPNDGLVPMARPMHVFSGTAGREQCAPCRRKRSKWPPPSSFWPR
jgi:hypothetical protein